jgi:hypothetical protein
MRWLKVQIGSETSPQGYRNNLEVPGNCVHQHACT